MLHMPTHEIISKICELSKTTEGKVKDMIKKKVDELDGLVSEEGAAHIVANELGVKLFEKQMSGTPIKIVDVLVGMKSVNVVGKVMRVFEARKFIREGKENKVGSFVIADETDSIRIVLWDSKRIDLLEDGTVKEGDVISIKDGYVRENKFSGKEIHIGLRGQLILDVDTKIDVKVQEKTIGGETQEAKIAEAVSGGMYRICGTVVAVFNPNFYSACSECGRKVQQDGEKLVCQDHKESEAKTGMALNLVLDDGTANMRCAAFQQTAEELLGKNGEELKGLSSEELTDVVNKALLGIELEIEGPVRENQMFGRTEIIANKASKLDPKIIIKKLKGGKK